jgi:hypothetical protein
MRRWTLGGLDQFAHNMRGCRSIGITHGHVDDVLAPSTRRHFELSRNVKNIGGQTLDARELPHPESLYKKFLILLYLQCNKTL